MAIKIDLQTSQFGVPFKGAYFRIISATAKRGDAAIPKFVAMIDVAGYGTDSPEAGMNPIDMRRYGAQLEEVEAMPGETFIERCYAWLMAQDSMSGAVAV